MAPARGINDPLALVIITIIIDFLLNLTIQQHSETCKLTHGKRSAMFTINIRCIADILLFRYQFNLFHHFYQCLLSTNLFDHIW